jgi:hypothetical protein
MLFKRVVLISFALTSCLLTPAAAQASGTSPSAIVTAIYVMYGNGGQVIFYTSGAHSGQPACATQNTRWIFAGTTTAGQATLSLVMTAYATGKPITVYGTGACDMWPDTETVNYITQP